MSHHFDTKLAKSDPSLNICDMYLFEGAPGTTVMAMTVNPDVGRSVPDILHAEGLYAFRFDLNADGREDVAFKFRFREPKHADNDEHVHVQPFEVRRITGETDQLLIEGETGTVQSLPGIQAYAGTAPDLFAGDAGALRNFLTAFHNEHRYHEAAFLNRQNFFAKRNVTAIVLEVPNSLIGEGKVRAWATTSLSGHAPEVQVQRWGLPLITHIFLSASDDLKDKFNASAPSEDLANVSTPIAEFTRQMTTYAGSATNPTEYGRQIAARFCPVVLPYDLGTRAAFNQAAFNGRPLVDDAMDAMLSLAVNKPLADGVAPDQTRTSKVFPYFGTPYTKSEQAGVTPVPQPPKK